NILTCSSQANALKRNGLSLRTVAITACTTFCVILRQPKSPMPAHQHSQTIIRFGPFDADLQTQELKKQGVRLPLPGPVFSNLRDASEAPRRARVAKRVASGADHPTLP